MSEELAVIDGEATELMPSQQALNLFGSDNPIVVVNRATEVADALARVLEQQGLYKTISGKKHVLVEGWTLLGSMLGVFPVCEWTRQTDTGWEARVEARTLAGSVVGAAETSCDKTENLWKNRDDHAIRSMAQTRATSKALKQPLGFVVALAGFSATPAEEMPSEPLSEEGATGTGSEPPPSSESGYAPTEQQFAAYHEAFAEAKKRYPDGQPYTPDGPNVPWRRFAELYCKDQFNKTSSAALSGPELEQLTQALKDASLPF